MDSTQEQMPTNILTLPLTSFKKVCNRILVHIYYDFCTVMHISLPKNVTPSVTKFLSFNFTFV